MVKKKSFKYISLIILAIIIIAILVINVRKTEVYAAKIQVDDLTYTYTESYSSKNLVITGSGKVTKNWQSNEILGSYKEIITYVGISSSVTDIEESAFEGCTALKQVKFNNGIKMIGNNAFKGCTSLTAINSSWDYEDYNYNLPKSVTEIGQSAFENCTSLQTITINSSPTIGTDAFSNCSPTLVVKITSAKATTYPISQDGIYKIEAHGGKGGDVSVTDGYTTREGTGAKGGKSIGYIQLSKNNKLTTEIYKGGNEASIKQNGVTSESGYGGNGIGIKLGESTVPLLAAGGGGGAGGIRVCPKLSHFHGNAISKKEHKAAAGWNKCEGMDGKAVTYEFKEVGCGSGNAAITSGGGGGGYPKGGVSEQTTMDGPRVFRFVLRFRFGIWK